MVSQVCEVSTCMHFQMRAHQPSAGAATAAGSPLTTYRRPMQPCCACTHKLPPLRRAPGAGSTAIATSGSASPPRASARSCALSTASSPSWAALPLPLGPAASRALSSSAVSSRCMPASSVFAAADDPAPPGSAAGGGADCRSTWRPRSKSQFKRPELRLVLELASTYKSYVCLAGQPKFKTIR